MSQKKFMGKIRTEPWEALARGPREVMASLWQEYLQDILKVSKQSGRFRRLQQEIEAATGYRQIYQDWNNLSPDARAEAWRRLMAAAREQVEARTEACVRCGECCEQGSPTLLVPDLELLQKEILAWTDVYTLRPGQKVTSREGKVTILPEERLKVREVPGTHQCCYYLAATNTCRIYDDRPEQCRRQHCWGEPAKEPEKEAFLNRSHLLQPLPEIWELVRTHQERCGLADVAQAVQALTEGKEEAADVLFEALHFDHYLREMLVKEWDLSADAIELLLGAPMPQFLRELGLTATITPDGTFRLTPRSEQ